MRYYIAVFLIIAVLIVPSVMINFPTQSVAFVNAMNKIGNQLAAVITITRNPVTIDEVRNNYATATTPRPDGTAPRKVRILVVPGHEPTYGGAEGYGLKERHLTLELGQNLIKYLETNDRYEVFTTRDAKGWTPEFAAYFKSNWDEIKEWTNAHVAETRSLQSVGTYSRVAPPVGHAKADPSVALRLYGVNKWANENDIDIAIHIHFNDYPGHGSGPGKYTGFAIYVPERQYFNSTTTNAIALSVRNRLARYNPISNLPGESEGIVQEQDLIAIGAFNSIDAASMLTEYGYLYEQRLQDPDVRRRTLDEMAYATYLGLLDFFEPTAASSVARTYDTKVLPYRWTRVLGSTDDSAEDIFALQTALVLSGDYPPKGKTLNDCPRSGSFGPCTKAALSTFQAKHQIVNERDVVGEQTLGILNRIYGNPQ